MPSSKETETTVDEQSEYKVKNMKFIVEPIFSTTTKETLGSILLRLIQAEYS